MIVAEVFRPVPEREVGAPGTVWEALLSLALGSIEKVLCDW